MLMKNNLIIRIYPFSILKGTGLADKNFKTTVYKEKYIQFFTSQDRPEEQLAPTLISLNATYAVVGVMKPLKSNGIILLYQIWIHKNNNQGYELACSIEEWYDPNDLDYEQSHNVPKICVIKNLEPSTNYKVSATSTTVIGSSTFSDPLMFKTLEMLPKCSVEIMEALSRTSDSVEITWKPNLNGSKSEPSWINCISGELIGFKVYLKDNKDNFELKYQGNL